MHACVCVCVCVVWGVLGTPLVARTRAQLTKYHHSYPQPVQLDHKLSNIPLVVKDAKSALYTINNNDNVDI